MERCPPMSENASPTLISLVVPCFNEEESLPIFLDAAASVRDEMRARWDVEFEVVLVDDGSKDATLEVMRTQAEERAGRLDIRWLSFSRNFGKEAALLAGLEHTRGDYVATLDADMQDPPSLLPQMYEILLEGEYDNVATRRVTREGEPPIRSFFARMFYRIMGRISQAEVVDGARDFRLMKRVMVDAILAMPEYNRFSKGIYGWVGFRTKWLPYTNLQRVAGETKWSFWSLFRYSIEGIIAFSTVPLAVASGVGLLLFLLSFVMVGVVVIRALLFGDPVAGWPSIVTIMLFLGGVQLLSLGVIGQYLARIYLESKRRPIYLVARTNIPAEERR